MDPNYGSWPGRGTARAGRRVPSFTFTGSDPRRLAEQFRHTAHVA